MSEVLYCPECKKESVGGYIICEKCYEQLLARLTRLQKRDCNAIIQLCFNDGDDPFARENLQVVDVGVSDNCYVVESQTVKLLQAQLATAKEENKQLQRLIMSLRDVLNYNEYSVIDMDILLECLTKADCETFTKDILVAIDKRLIESGLALLPTTDKAIRKYGQ